MTIPDMAEQMFNAYNDCPPNTWQTFDGRPVPRWRDLTDQVRAKWTAAAEVARLFVLSDTHELELGSYETSPERICHALHEGFSLCGMGAPREWPPIHCYLALEEVGPGGSLVNCEGCLREHAKRVLGT